jgi:hypothetical protein
MRQMIQHLARPRSTRGASAPAHAVVALLLLLAGQALAQVTPPNPDLGRARLQFQDLEYERCLESLDETNGARMAHGEEAEVALYRGLCLHGLGRETEAAQAFREARRTSPTIAPPTWSSPKVRDFFASAIPPDTSDAAPAAPEPVLLPSLGTAERLEAPADAPRLEPLPPAPTGRLDALADAPRLEPLPVAPIVLAGSAVVALGVGLFFGMRSSDAIQQAEAATFESTWAEHRGAAQRQATIANVGFGLSAISALAAGVTGALLWPRTPPKNERD